MTPSGAVTDRVARFDPKGRIIVHDTTKELSTGVTVTLGVEDKITD